MILVELSMRNLFRTCWYHIAKRLQLQINPAEKKDNEQLNDIQPHDIETGTESDVFSEAQLNDNQPDNLPSVSPCDFNVNRIDDKRGSTDAHQQRSVKVSVIDFTQKIFSNDKVCEADNTSKVFLNETDKLPPSHITFRKNVRLRKHK